MAELTRATAPAKCGARAAAVAADNLIAAQAGAVTPTPAGQTGDAEGALAAFVAGYELGVGAEWLPESMQSDPRVKALL